MENDLIETTSPKNEEDELSLVVIDYALQYANAINRSYYNGVFTPNLLNERLKDINLNPLQASESDLKNAIDNIKTNEALIQQFSQDFEIQSQPYKRLLDYLGDLLAFDLTCTCINAEESDYNKKGYKSDLAKVAEFFDRFDYRFEFQNVVAGLLRNETFFCCPRYDTGRITLQELPASPDYTLINGKWGYGLLFAFNMNWFLQSGVNVRDYPPFFIESYDRVFGRTDAMEYDPNKPPRQRDSYWANWVDVPVDVGWCWKMNPRTITRAPYFTGLMLDLVLQPLLRSLQKSANMAAAAKMIIGEIPLLKDSATGTRTKDQFALSPANLGNFMSFVKAAIGDAVKVATAPLTNISAVNFPAEEKLYSTFMKTALASSGVNTNLLFTSDLKMNTVETQLSVNTDEQLMRALYPQFEAFLNYHVNRMTKHFKFAFRFEGTHFYTDREVRFGYQKDLMAQGVVMPQKIFAAIGMNAFEAERMLAEARANKFVDKLTPILGAQAQFGGSDTGGRPKKPTSKLSESGEQTRQDGGNLETKK